MRQQAIFIGYRRDDTADVAGRVYDALAQRFGKRRIFKDVDDLSPGVDFEAAIRGVLPKCRVFLALIGPSWSSTRDQSGGRRLDNPDDWVRREIELALSCPGLNVVPVLVNGATLPRSEDLPVTMRGLLRRQAASVRRDPEFHKDMLRLTKVASQMENHPSDPAPSYGKDRPVARAQLLSRGRGKGARAGAIWSAVAGAAGLLAVLGGPDVARMSSRAEAPIGMPPAISRISQPIREVGPSPVAASVALPQAASLATPVVLEKAAASPARIVERPEGGAKRYARLSGMWRYKEGKAVWCNAKWRVRSQGQGWTLEGNDRPDLEDDWVSLMAIGPQSTSGFSVRGAEKIKFAGRLVLMKDQLTLLSEAGSKLCVYARNA